MLRQTLPGGRDGLRERLTGCGREPSRIPLGLNCLRGEREAPKSEVHWRSACSLTREILRSWYATTGHFEFHVDEPASSQFVAEGRPEQHAGCAKRSGVCPRGGRCC